MTDHTAGEFVAEGDELPWMIEFRQDYMNGLSVKKRGLDATPMVMRKYGIRPDEVMAFSNYEKRNQAMSVFHFHPDFPFASRRRYMEMHSEGYEVAEDAVADIRSETRHVRAERIFRLKAFSRSILVTCHAMALYVLTHHADTR